MKIREKYSRNKGSKYILKEKFLENLFLNQNYYSIAVLVINANTFILELLEDLENLYNYYSGIDLENSEIEQQGIIQMKENIGYVINLAKLLNSREFLAKGKEMPQFNFPKKLRDLPLLYLIVII